MRPLRHRATRAGNRPPRPDGRQRGQHPRHPRRGAEDGRRVPEEVWRYRGPHCPRPRVEGQGPGARGAARRPRPALARAGDHPAGRAVRHPVHADAGGQSARGSGARCDGGAGIQDVASACERGVSRPNGRRDRPRSPGPSPESPRPTRPLRRPSRRGRRSRPGSPAAGGRGSRPLRALPRTPRRPAYLCPRRHAGHLGSPPRHTRCRRCGRLRYRDFGPRPFLQLPGRHVVRDGRRPSVVGAGANGALGREWPHRRRAPHPRRSGPDARGPQPQV